jgi:hypothetical protein
MASIDYLVSKYGCLQPWEREWIDKQRKEREPLRPMIADYPVYEDNREEQDEQRDDEQKRGVLIIELSQYKSL